MAERRQIILDCDPGVDDAVALCVAQGHPDLELLAVTTVGGNQSLSKVTDNALALAAHLRLDDVPVAAGCAVPLLRAPRDARHVHGESGLGDVVLPPGDHALDPRHAVDVIVETLMSRPAGTVTLVPIGPLTNLALAVHKEPAIVARVREVVLMGGAIGPGNVSPVAEFNIATDPHAARVVFRAGWPLTMVGLDATHATRVDEEIVARVRALGTPAAALAADLLDCTRRTYPPSARFVDPPCHDPLALAAVADPAILQTVAAPVDVEVAGDLTTGMTVVDLRLQAPPDCPTRVATAIDRDRFWDVVCAGLRG